MTPHWAECVAPACIAIYLKTDPRQHFCSMQCARVSMHLDRRPQRLEAVVAHALERDRTDIFDGPALRAAFKED